MSKRLGSSRTQSTDRYPTHQGEFRRRGLPLYRYANSDRYLDGNRERL